MSVHEVSLVIITAAPITETLKILYYPLEYNVWVGKTVVERDRIKWEVKGKAIPGTGRGGP
jgi:hypothetical protein